MTGIYNFPPTKQLSLALQRRTGTRLSQMGDDEVYAYLSDTIYKEKLRLEDGEGSATSRYLKSLQSAGRSIRKDRASMINSLMNLVDIYVHEVHNHFSPRTYGFASKVLPGALTRLLTAAQPSQLLGADFDPASRIVVQGPVKKLQKLAKSHTLIYTPTHLSNLDSPLIGYALLQAKLPPVIYGAGLNLFNNPLMSFFMSRLGAYTVDRCKKNDLYKHVLKDYSIEAIRHNCHSLFFPGGTRSRTGKLEQKLKKGLLGTGIKAWQENIEDSKGKDVLVIPCTLSFSLTLEAETLIDDALSEEGKSRYIITDDEFSEAKLVADYARKALNLDASVYVRFGEAMDLVGNPVDQEGLSLDPTGRIIDRREYITNRYGNVVRDDQRDQIYTELLSKKITAAYKKDNIVLPTQISAYCAWELLKWANPRLDAIQLALLRPEERRISRVSLLKSIDRVQKQILKLKSEGEICEELQKNPADILQDALIRFKSFHRNRTLAVRGDQLEVSGKLALYYGNRLQSYPLNAMGEI